jgi:hypothetical protein
VKKLLSVAVSGMALALPAAPATASEGSGLWSESHQPTAYDCGPFSRDSNDFCHLDDSGAVELGVKFQASRTLDIVGVRAYVTGGNGTFTGTLWATDGTQLERASRLANTSVHSWQDVRFDDPVRVAAGTTYLASYRAPTAEYPFQWGAFAAGPFTVGPLTALQSGASNGNGVFCYDGESCAGFPANWFPFAGDPRGVGTNYWVTPLYDDAPPTLAPHADVTADATSADGAVVTYTAPSATDVADEAPVVDCTPASGSQFPPGATTVSCTATDASGNQSTSTFSVTVLFDMGPFLPPVGKGKTAYSMKAGSTLPLKWQVRDGSGGYIGDVGIVESVDVSCTTSSARVAGKKLRRKKSKRRARKAGHAEVRYDASEEQYIYNWKSPKTRGSCDLTVHLTDDSSHTVSVTLR